MDSKSDSEDGDEYCLKLDTIPPEIFLHICSFISAKFVINVLSKVCQQFNEIIQNDTTWRMRIFKKWPRQYPLIPDPSLDWKEACIEREEHYDLWKNSGENMKMFHIKDAHFGSVNVVNILEDGWICASGGRDGALKLWNVSNLKETPEPQDYKSCLLNSKAAAHGNAWLGPLHMISKQNDVFCLASPILCLAFSHNALASGCYGRSVSLFDPRVSLQPVMQHIHHKKPVICIASDEKFIISGSEDKTVVVYDKIARKVLKTLQFEGFPLSMSSDFHQLLVGDVLGFFHVIDPTEQSFELVQTYETGHKLKVTGIQHSLGSIITCSTDKTIRILEPNADPQPIAVLNCSSEVSKISAYKTILASANTDDSITIWIPEEECS
ncbi:F-box/WD repeat-containing protein 9 [Araneus ventricosus]|uniref:F-box/WD repeat-containing protein 9 n=1 Tax=Araneus ventricosus TaxID=182803 RepID=A0A4Y2ISD5_ARAVE|nr:F-box/WD repeat-containing protein 9 [Araneus ventricosus]